MLLMVERVSGVKFILRLVLNDTHTHTHTQLAETRRQLQLNELTALVNGTFAGLVGLIWLCVCVCVCQCLSVSASV